MLPLTHHDILTLVGAFSRHGRRVDLAACERAARKVAFQPVTHTAIGAAGLTLVESLVLENPRPGAYRVVRTLRHGNGTTASLQVDGSSPEAVYERVLALAPERQFTLVAGLPVAHSYTVDLARAPEASLTAAEAAIDTLQLRLATQAGLRGPAEISLHGAEEWQLPEDFLAVLGPAWRPLVWRRDGWRGPLHAPHREPRRSEALRACFERTVAHSVATLAAPPQDFHTRFRGARWRATLRRGVPLLVFIALLASMPLMQVLWIDQGRALPVWVLGLPPLLLIGAFFAASYHVPEIVVPPLPRPLRPGAWQPIRVIT